MRAVAGVAVLGLVALSGCADSSAEPRVLPSLSASPSPSAAPTPTGKDAPTAEGASEFARFFYAQLGRAFMTKNPDLISVLSTSSCKVCQTYVESVAGLRANDEHVDQFNVRVAFAVATAVNDNKTRVDVGWSANAVTRYDAQGNVILREKAMSGVEEQLDLVRVAGSWKVNDYTRIRVRG